MSTRDTIIASAARAFYVVRYADLADGSEGPEGARDKRRAGPGEDWMDVAPATPRSAMRLARKFIATVERINGADVATLYARAEGMEGKRYADPTPDRFGHDLAMSAMGTGVSWTDNHPETGIKVPDASYQDARGYIDERFTSVRA